MEDPQLIIDLGLTLGAAVILGALAARIGLPVIVGYIAAGMIVGPNTPGFDADRHQAELLANVGVAILMFALGAEFSLGELLRVRRVALITAGIQLPAMIGLGALIGVALGWTVQGGVLLGGAVAISSAIVAIKVLIGRGEMGSRHAALVIGVGVVQDLSLVVMLALVPILTDDGGNILITLARSLAISTIAIAIAALAGPRLLPRMLARVAGNGNRDLFILAAIVIALGSAAAAHEVGLSFALGAFLAGIIVSESEFSGQIAAQIEPIRDLFATIFFVAVGMLLKPSVIVDNLGSVLAIIAITVIGKIIITGGALLASGVDHWTATRVAVILGQMGEFSFVLAGVGLSKAIIDQRQYGLILSAAIGSIFVMPLVLASTPALLKIADRLPGVKAREEGSIEPIGDDPTTRGHVLICGYGRIGSELAAALASYQIPYAVIDLNPATIRTLREQGVWAAWGDAAEEAVLASTGLPRAATIAITIPDDSATRTITRIARHHAPRIQVIARATASHMVDTIAHAGANEVVQPEFEAGLEFARQVLAWHDANESAVRESLALRRGHVYHVHPHDGVLIHDAG